jgi:hypothetical protein
MEAQMRQILKEEQSKTRGFQDTVRGFLLAVYGLTIARWTNPMMYQVTWYLLSLEPSEIATLQEEKDGSQEDPTNPPANERTVKEQ